MLWNWRDGSTPMSSSSMRNSPASSSAGRSCAPSNQTTATRHIALISCSWLSEPEVRSLVGGLAGHLQKPDFRYSDFEQALASWQISSSPIVGPPGRRRSQSGAAKVPLTDPQTKG